MCDYCAPSDTLSTRSSYHRRTLVKHVMVESMERRFNETTERTAATKSIRMLYFEEILTCRTDFNESVRVEHNSAYIEKFF